MAPVPGSTHEAAERFRAAWLAFVDIVVTELARLPLLRWLTRAARRLSGGS